MSKFTPEQLKKLPKWAQDHIVWQERELVRLNGQVENLTGTEASPIEVDPYRDALQLPIGKLARTFLPERITVRYMLEGGHIDVGLRKGRVDINATRMGDNAMEIRPSAANSLTVGFGETKS